MLKAVLFDLDNTLIDWDATGSWHTELARRMAILYDFIGQRVQPWDGTTVDMLQARFIEALDHAWAVANQTLVPVDHMGVLRSALAACGVPEDRLTRELLDDAYDWQPHENLQIYPEVPEVLDQLRARRPAGDHHERVAVDDAARPRIDARPPSRLLPDVPHLGDRRRFAQA